MKNSARLVNVWQIAMLLHFKENTEEKLKLKENDLKEAEEVR